MFSSSSLYDSLPTIIDHRSAQVWQLSVDLHYE
jgi:hypothetical protein